MTAAGAASASNGFIFLSSQLSPAEQSQEWNAEAGSSSSRHVIASTKSAMSLRNQAEEQEDHSFNDSRNSTSPRSFLPPLTPSRYHPPSPSLSSSSTSPPSESSPSKAPRTPRRRPGSILRPHHTPGTGSSVRFGKRLYDDGAESSVSTIFESPVAESSVGGLGRAVQRSKGSEEMEEEKEEDGTTEELFLPTPPVLRGVSTSAKGETDEGEDSFEDAGQIEQMLSPSKRPAGKSIISASHPPNPFLRTTEIGSSTPGSSSKKGAKSKSSPSLQEANQRALSGRKRSSKAQGDASADISAADSSASSSSSSGSSSADSSRGNGKHGGTDSSPTIRVGAGAGGILRKNIRSPLSSASPSSGVQGEWDESEVRSAKQDAIRQENEEEEGEEIDVPRGILPREDSIASLQLADLPSLDNVSSLFETNAAALQRDESAVDAPSMRRASTRGASPSSASRATSSPLPNEHISDSTSTADQSISMSVSMLEREATGFRQRWEAEEEKEKSRRMSMGGQAALQNPLEEEQEEEHALVETGTVSADQERIDDQSSSLSPATVPLPASPASASNIIPPRTTSPLAADGEDLSTDSTDSQPHPSPGPNNASSPSVFVRGRALLQRHSTPPVSSTPSSPVQTQSPSVARQGRRTPVLPNDLRKQIARKSFPSGIKNGTSPSFSKDLLPPASHRISSPLSRSSLGNGSFTSFASTSLASASASAAQRSSLFFDVAEESANLSAVFETARELDEVHSERTLHLIERLQQGDHEIVSLRQTLQKVASSELDALKEIDLLRQRAENAELALLREKEEAFAAARLQDQQHSEVAALIERLKGEIDQQQNDIEIRAQVQQEAFAQQEELISMLQEEVEGERQGKEQDQRDFEVRLLAAREEERATVEQNLEEEKEAARRLAVDACERDFAIRQARDAEDAKFTIYQLEDKLASTEEQLLESRSREEQLQSRLHELEQELAEAQKNLDNEISRSKSQVAQAADDAAAECARAEALEQENLDLRIVVEKLQTAGDEASEVNKDKASEQHSLLCQLASAEAKILELETTVAELGARHSGTQPAGTVDDNLAATREDTLAEELTQARFRISKLERMNASSGIEIAKLMKLREQLERDNRNYGIALSAKQSELSMLKRNGGIRYALALSPRESAVPDTIRRLGLMPLANVAQSTQDQLADSEMITSPSQHKATRLKEKKGAESREGLLAGLKAPLHTIKEKQGAVQVLQENNPSVQHIAASRRLRTPIHED